MVSWQRDRHMQSPWGASEQKCFRRDTVLLGWSEKREWGREEIIDRSLVVWVWLVLQECWGAMKRVYAEEVGRPVPWGDGWEDRWLR